MFKYVSIYTGYVGESLAFRVGKSKFSFHVTDCKRITINTMF
jgi:hypothetical protein